MKVVTCQFIKIINTFSGLAKALSKPNMNKKNLVLFDIDGTLTKPIHVIEPYMEEFLLTSVKSKFAVGLVGGSDFKKISYQMNGENVIEKYDYVFAENGLIAYKHGIQLESQTIQKYFGEDNLQRVINFALAYMSTLSLPVKRGTFVEFRSGMLNISPVGRSCTQEERIQFYEYDKVHKIREKFIEALKEKFPELKLTYSIGGQISFDVFPVGWDKTYCLNIVANDKFDEIHFFGDKTSVGGNDHEIFNDSRTIGHTVTSPDDTKRQLEELLQNY